MKTEVEKARAAYAKAQRKAVKSGNYTEADRLFSAYVSSFARSL